MFHFQNNKLWQILNFQNFIRPGSKSSLKILLNNCRLLNFKFTLSQWWYEAMTQLVQVIKTCWRKIVLKQYLSVYARNIVVRIMGEVASKRPATAPPPQTEKASPDAHRQLIPSGSVDGSMRAGWTWRHWRRCCQSCLP